MNKLSSKFNDQHPRIYYFNILDLSSLIIIIIMSLTPVSSSDEDIGGVPSMQSSYSAGMKRCGICMEDMHLLECWSINASDQEVSNTDLILGKTLKHHRVTATVQ